MAKYWQQPFHKQYFPRQKFYRSRKSGKKSTGTSIEAKELWKI